MKTAQTEQMKAAVAALRAIKDRRRQEKVEMCKAKVQYWTARLATEQARLAKKD